MRMRVLFASLASPGHTFPLIPLAVAIREAGHDVHFAAGEAMHPTLFEHRLRPFRPADAFYEFYPEDLAPELDRLKPDLVIHEWGVPGAAVAAQQAGIPGIWHGFGRLYPDGIGLTDPTEVLEAAGRPHVDICPPSLQNEKFLATQPRIELRPVPYAAPDDPPPGSIHGAGGRPLIYLTLGTAFGTAELLVSAITALASLGGTVVVAAGRVPVAQLGDLPAHVLAQPWVPQAALLPAADLVVHHGGSATMLHCLGAGVPQLMLPEGADQFANAEAIVRAGAGLRLLPAERSTEAIAEQARMLCGRAGDGNRGAAQAIAVEIARMPAPAQVAQRLPDYATG